MITWFYPIYAFAIVLTLSSVAAEKGETYAEVLTDARNAIQLADFGVEAFRYRIAQTGGRILEIPGSDRAIKADRWAGEIHSVLAERGVVVSKSENTAEIRIYGLDNLVTRNDIKIAMIERTHAAPAALKWTK